MLRYRHYGGGEVMSILQVKLKYKIYHKQKYFNVNMARILL